MRLAIAVTLLVCVVVVVDASILSLRMGVRTRDAIERCKNKGKDVANHAFGSVATTSERQANGPYQLPADRVYVCNFDHGNATVYGFRDGKQSNQLPSDLMRRFSDILVEFFRGAKNYLWVIDEKNNLVIAPENQPGATWAGKKEKKKITHGDLTPGVQPISRPGGEDAPFATEDEKENRITGTFQGVARAGGFIKFFHDKDTNKRVMLIDNNAGYSLSRLTLEEANKVTNWNSFSGPTQALDFENLKAVFCRISQLASAPLNGHQYTTEQQRGQRITCPGQAAADTAGDEVRVLAYPARTASSAAPTTATPTSPTAAVPRRAGAL